MNESSMTLLTDLSHLDVTYWDVSPKLHGCRAYWDGRQLWTRGGNIIKAPAWFTAEFPRHQASGTWRNRMMSCALWGRWLDSVQFGKVDSVDHLRRLLEDVRAGGGEGLVLRHPTHVGYEIGRSRHAMRVKDLAEIDRLMARQAA